MAYGSWSSSRWTQVWSNGYYKVEVQWRYRQDVPGNKTEYAVQQLRVTSINSYYSFRTTSATVGIATITSQHDTQSASVNVTAGGSATVNLSDKSREVAHNSNGVLTSESNVHGYFKANLGGANHVPEFGWAVTEITDLIPDIDRSGGTTTASLSSVTTTTARIKYESNVATTLIQYNLDGEGWKDAGVDLPNTGGGTTYFTISGLDPYSQHSVQVRHRRDYTQVYSSAKTISFRTAKPEAPVITSFNSGQTTGSSIVLTYSGELGEDYPSEYREDAKFVVEMLQDDSYVTVKETSFFVTSCVINDLEEDTRYTFRVSLLDYYESRSGYMSISAQTAFVGSKALVKVGGELKEGIVYVKAGGEVVRASDLKIKVGGELKSTR